MIVGVDPPALYSLFPLRPVHERAAEIEDHRTYHADNLAWTRISENLLHPKFAESGF